mgnify:CR=1 FL=1
MAGTWPEHEPNPQPTALSHRPHPSQPASHAAHPPPRPATRPEVSCPVTRKLKGPRRRLLLLKNQGRLPRNSEMNQKKEARGYTNYNNPGPRTDTIIPRTSRASWRRPLRNPMTNAGPACALHSNIYICPSYRRGPADHRSGRPLPPARGRPAIISQAADRSVRKSRSREADSRNKCTAGGERIAFVRTSGMR